MLHYIDFSYFETCIGCIKGKLPTRVRKGKMSRKQDVLGLIHTDINEPIMPNAIGDHKYFITFIDYYSKYGWVELLNEKTKSLDAFK